MNRTFILITVLFVFVSGCTGSNQAVTPDKDNPLPEKPAVTETSSIDSQSGTKNVPDGIAAPQVTITQTVKPGDLLVDRISLNLTSFYDKKWYNLYQADELDCSRMSTYFWNYTRSNYHVAPKIVVSYQRQHAWLALKVSDVGNSSNYRHWNIKGIDYYYLEATIPKIVVDDNQRFLINGQPYTSAEFYNATIYVFDSPQDANDFHADYSILRGFNQEFVLKKYDLDKIEKFLE